MPGFFRFNGMPGLLLRNFESQERAQSDWHPCYSTCCALTIVGGGREAWVVCCRGTQSILRARGRWRAWSSGPSTSPLDVCEMRPRVANVFWVTLALVVGAATLGTILDWLWQGHLVRRSIAAIHRNYPLGMQLVDARTRVRHDYSRFTERTAATCTKDAGITSPRYFPQGGACIFGIDETGSTWWGYESAVEFRLLFGSDDKLRDVQALPVYTFL